MDCPNCHSPVLPGSVFCSKCGAPMEGIAPRSADAGHIRIGRVADNDVCLNDDKVSRYHAALLRQNDGTWRIEDLSSKNGTFVNEERVASRAVSPTDQIRLGSISTSVAELLAQSSPQAPQDAMRAPIQHNFEGSGSATLADTPPTEIKIVIFLNILIWIISIFYTISTYDPSYSYSPLSREITKDIGSMCITIFFLYKIYKLRNWARIWYIISSGIVIIIITVVAIIFISNISHSERSNFIPEIVLFVICLICAILTIYYLTRPNVVAAFKKKHVS